MRRPRQPARDGFTRRAACLRRTRCDVGRPTVVAHATAATATSPTRRTSRPPVRDAGRPRLPPRRRRQRRRRGRLRRRPARQPRRDDRCCSTRCRAQARRGGPVVALRLGELDRRLRHAAAGAHRRRDARRAPSLSYGTHKRVCRAADRRLHPARRHRRPRAAAVRCRRAAAAAERRALGASTATSSASRSPAATTSARSAPDATIWIVSSRHAPSPTCSASPRSTRLGARRARARSRRRRSPSRSATIVAALGRADATRRGARPLRAATRDRGAVRPLAARLRVRARDVALGLDLPTRRSTP